MDLIVKDTSLEKKSKILNYLLMYLLLGFSGTIFLSFKDFLLSGFFILVLIIFIEKRLTIDTSFYIFSFYILFLVIAQTMTFGAFSIIGVVRGVITFTLPYFVIKIVGIDYTKYFVKLMYFFTIISFVFYFPSLISPSFHSYIATIADKLGTDAFLANEWGYNGRNFIIYTWRDWYGGFLRNSGNFTEAGAFASMLIVALIISTVESKKLISKENIVFIVAIITTFSTSGYIALFLFIIFWTSVKFKPFQKIIFYPIALYFSINLFSSLPFLEDKIEFQYYSQMEGRVSSIARGRFTSALIDFNDIVKYPISGRGFIKETRFDRYDYHLNHRTNGITGFIVVYGPFGFLMYLFFMLRSFKKYCSIKLQLNLFAYLIIIVILSISFAQYILFTPILFSFVFLDTLLTKKNLYGKDFALNNYPKL
jgi:hypothetical protein